jgi:hypothetical protein
MNKALEKEAWKVKQAKEDAKDAKDIKSPKDKRK